MSWQAEYEKFRDGFASAIDPRFHTIEWLDEQIATGRAFVWFGQKAAIVAAIKEYPTGTKAIHGLCEAGDPQEVIETLIPAAEAWGRQQGCQFAEIQSRPAWARLLKGRGYLPFQTSILKEL